MSSLINLCSLTLLALMVQYPPLTFVAQCRNLTEVLPCVVASCPVDPLRHIDLFIYWDLLRPGLGQKINTRDARKLILVDHTHCGQNIYIYI